MAQDKTTQGCILAVLVFLMIIPATLLNAFVLTYLWRWFVVAHFGLSPIGIAEAIGLTLMVSYLVKSPDDRDNKEKGMELFWTLMARMILRPLFVFVFGWIIQHWL